MAAEVQLVPYSELAPGAITAIRNQVIRGVLAQAARELHLPETDLVVRDIRPLADLSLYSTGTTTSTSERWGYAATGTTTGYVAINASTNTMSDMRYCALYGVRDSHSGGVSGSATLAPLTGNIYAVPSITLIKINVGGSDKVIWDTTGMYSYRECRSAFATSAVVIPQNVTFQISYYRQGSMQVGVPSAPVTDEISWIQLIGVIVEPRGKVISP